MAAAGAATRAIGRALGCTTGAASKWRVRHAKDRLAGFSEVGRAALIGNMTRRRIAAFWRCAIRCRPKVYANWTGSLLERFPL
jgi:hypothetical protein